MGLPNTTLHVVPGDDCCTVRSKPDGATSRALRSLMTDSMPSRHGGVPPTRNRVALGLLVALANALNTPQTASSAVPPRQGEVPSADLTASVPLLHVALRRPT
jgi:hypothetical protein